MVNRLKVLLPLFLLFGSLVAACALERDDVSASAGASSWLVVPGELVADNTAEAAIDVAVFRPSGAPWSQARVALRADDAAVTLATDGQADAAGLVHATAVCRKAGSYTITAWFKTGALVTALTGAGTLVCIAADSNVPLPAPVPQQVAIIAQHTVAAADFGAPVLITLVVTDAQGKPVADQLVTLSTLRPGDTVVPSTATTNAQGQVQVALTAAELGTATLVAHAGQATAQATVRIVAGAPDMSKTTFSPIPGRVTANAHDQLSFFVEVRDSAGNFVPYADVTFTSDTPGDVLTPSRILTDSMGQARTMLTGTKAGGRTVTVASHTGLLPSQATLVAGPMAAGQSTLVFSPNTTTADGISPVTLIAVLADAFGNPLANEAVTLSSSVGSDVLPRASTTSDDAASLQAILTGTQAQSRELTVTAARGGAALTAQLTLVAGTPDTRASTLSANPTTVTAGAPAQLTLRLVDTQNNPVAGMAVTFRSSAPGDSLTPQVATTDAQGGATATFVGTSASSHTIVASIGGAGTSLVLHVPVTAAALDAGHSDVLASSTQSVANGTASVNITVLARDSYGNPLPGAAVGLSADGTGAVFAPPAGTTLADGTFVSALTTTKAQRLQVTPTVAGTALPPVAVQFVAGATDAVTSTLSINPNVAVADGQDTQTLRVALKDAQGNPQVGRSVVFAIAVPGVGRLAPASGTTDAAGELTTTLTSVRAGPRTITAAAGGVTLTATCNFLPGPPSAATSTLTSAPSAITADGQSQAALTATLQDAFGNALGVVPVTWSFVDVGGTVTPPSGNSSSAGVATAVAVGTVAGQGRVQLQAGSITLQHTISLVPGAPDAAQSTVTLSPNTQVADGSPIAVAVQLRDAQGNAVPDIAVAFDPASGLVSLPQGQTNADAAGRVATVWSSTLAGPTTLRVHASLIALQANATFVAGSAVSARSTFVANPPSLTADGVAQGTLTVTLADAYGNPVASAPIALLNAAATDVLLPPSGATDASGQWRSHITAVLAGSRTLTANSGPVHLDAPMTFVPGPPASASSLLTVSPNMVVANGANTATVRWLLRDAAGNPTPLVPVTFTSGGAVASLTQASSTTDAAGAAQVLVSGTQAGTTTVHATSASASSDVGITWLAGPPATTNSTFAAGGPQVADNTTFVPLQLQLRDAFNNPVSGVAVALSTAGTGNFSQASGLTDVDGRFVSGIKSATIGGRAVSVATGQGALTTVATFVSGPPSASTSALHISPNLIRADGTSQSVLRLQVFDAFRNVASGANVVFTSSDGNDMFVGPLGASDASGQYATAVASTVVGDKTITANLGGGEVLTGTLKVVPTNATLSSVQFTASPNVLVAGSGQYTTLAVSAKDASNNPLAGYRSQLSITSPTGVTDDSLIGFRLLSNGTASATLGFSQVGTTHLSVTFDGIRRDTQVLVLAGSPAVATSSFEWSPPQVTADGLSTGVATVVLLDAQNNPVANAQVVLSADASVTLGQSTLTTDAGGIAHTTLVSQVAGHHAVTATAGALVLPLDAVFVPGAADALASSLVTSPNQATVGGNSVVTTTLNLMDARGNNLPSTAVTFSASNEALLSAPVVLTTNAVGMAVIPLSTTRAGVYTVTASAPGLTLTSPITFLSGSPNQMRSRVALTPGTAVADGTAQLLATALMQDDFSNPVPDVPIAWSCSAPGVVLSGASGRTDDSGSHSIFAKSTLSGAMPLFAQAPGLPLSVQMLFTAGPAVASTSSFSVAPGTIVANGIDAANLTLVARDALGNPAANQRVTASAPVGSIALTGPVTTDSNGLWLGTAKSTVAQSQQLTVTLGGAALNAPVDFVPGPPSAQTSTVLPSAPATVANGQSQVNLTVRAADAGNNSIAGRAVTLTIGGTGNTPGPLTGVTDASGQWRTTLASTCAELKSLSAAIDSVTAQGNVLFVAGAPSSSSSWIAASPNRLIADGLAQTVVTVLARDAFGNAVSGQQVAMVPMPSGYTLATSSGVTDAAGAWATHLTATKAGSPTLTAVLGSASVTGTVTTTPGAPSAQTSTFVASAPSFAADGMSQLSLFLQLADAFNNPIPGAQVQFTSATAADVLWPQMGATVSTGGLSTALTAQDIGSHTITATIGALALPVVVSAGPGQPDSGTSVLTFSPNTVTADNVSVAVVKAIVADRLGHRLPGQAVSFSVSDGQGTFAAPTGNTDAAGVYQTTLASRLAAVKTITANLGATAIGGQVTFVAGPMNSQASGLTASPSMVTADGQAQSLVRLTARDAQNNPITSRAVTFSALGSNNTLVPAASTTSDTGEATATLASTRAENKIAVAHVDSTAVSTQLSFVAGSVSNQSTSLTASPNLLVADGSQATFVLRLADAQDNPLAGQNVTVSATGSNNMLSATSGSSDGSGLFTVTLASTTAEYKTVTMTSGGVFVSAQVRFVAGAPVAASSIFTASPNQVVADGNGLTQLRLVLRDAYGNVVPNVVTSYTVTGSGDTLSTPQPTTDATGTVVTTLQSTVAENKSVTAHMAGISLAVPVTFIAGPAANSASTFTINPGTIAADGVSQATLVVLLNDAFGNPVQNANVQFGASGAGFAIAPGVVSTDASGRASAALTGTQAGKKIISASTSTTTFTSALLLTPGLPSNAHSSFTISPNIIVADGHSSATVAVIVRDAFDNLLSASPIFMTASGTQATFATPSGMTDGAGSFTTQVSATKSELKSITAALVGTSLTGQMSFTPGAINPNASSFVATPGQAVADNQTSIALTLTLADAFGNLVPQAAVNLSASGIRNVFDNVSGLSDGAGVFVAHVVSNKAQTETITASVGGTAVNTIVTFVPGASSNQSIILAAQPSYQAANANSPIAVTLFVADTFGNPVAGQAANFISSVPADVMVPDATTVTGADGKLVQYLTATQGGTRTLSASFSGLYTSTTVTIIPASAVTSTSMATIDPNTTTADGMSQATLVMTLRDVYGNLVPNQGVNVTLTQGDPALTALMPSSGYTNASGIFTAQITSTRAEPKSFLAAFGAASLSTTTLFVPGPVSPATSTLTGLPQSQPVDGSTPIVLTLQLRDAQGNIKPNEAVTLAASGGNNVLNPNVGVTDGNGMLTASLLSTRSEIKSLVATASNTSITGSVNFSPGDADGLLSSLRVVPALATADSQDTIVLSAVFRDRFGNVLQTGTVNFAGTGPSDTLSPTAANIASGVATASLKSTLARTFPVAATLGSITLNANASFVAGPASAGTSVLTISPNTQVVADGAHDAVLSVALNDAYGNPVGNQNVTFNITGGAPQPVPRFVLTSVGGVCSTTTASTLAGTMTVTASSGAVVLAGNLTFVAGSPNAAMSVLSISPNVLVADGNQSVALSGTFVDRYGNRVSNIAVSYSASGSDTYFTPPSSVSDAQGNFAAAARTTTLQTQTLTLSGGGLARSANVTCVVGPPNAAASSFVISPNANLLGNGNIVTTLNVTVRDKASHVVPSIPIRLYSANPAAVMTTPNSATSIFGTTSSTMRLRGAGPVPLFASSGNFMLSGIANFVPPTPACSGNIILGNVPNSVLNMAAVTFNQIVSADLNNDGNKDLIVVSSNANGIIAFFGDGAGQFPSMTPLATTGTATQVSAVDLNADGKTDLVLASQQNYITTYKNLGNKAFAAGVTYTLNGVIQSVCSADINRDSVPDMVAVSSSPAGFYVLLGDGSGGYSSATFYATTGVPAQCSARDFDGDGYVDVAVTNSSTNALHFFPGTSGGSFGSSLTYATGTTPKNIRSLLLNGDSLPDLVVANTGTSPGSLSIFLGKSGGGLTSQGNIAVDGNPTGIDIVDINGDGKNDVVVATPGVVLPNTTASSSEAKINILISMGNGNFQAPIRVGLDSATRVIAAADLNKDGLVDLIYGPDPADIRYSPSPTILQATAAMKYPVMDAYNLGVVNTATAAKIRTQTYAVDLDLDGNLDIVGHYGTSSYAGTPNAIVFPGLGDGTFKPPLGFYLTSAPRYMRIADINGDRLPDILGCGSDANLILLTNLGGMNFSAPEILSLDGAGGAITGLYPYDLNNDGVMDIFALRGASSTGYVLYGNGKPSRFDVSSVTLPSCPAAMTPVVFDVNNDGYGDLVVGCGPLYVYYGGVNGLATAATVYAADMGVMGTAILVPADVNNDGLVDVVATLADRMYVYINNAATPFSGPLIQPFYYHAGMTELVDMNGDGLADIVSGYQAGFFLRRNLGDNKFSGPSLYPHINVGSQVLVADLNNDNIPDVVVPNYTGPWGFSVFMGGGCAP